MKLSVIIPSYNEHRTIDTVIEKVRRVQVPGFEKEIIVVDGHSIDGTREILLAHQGEPDFQVIFESAPQGRGHALKEGLRVATGDVVIFQDADLELDPEDYPALLAPLSAGRADVVFGSRFLGQGAGNMGGFQYAGNRVLNIAVNLLFGTRLTDVETCYQVFRRELIQDFQLVNNDFAFTVELTVKLIKAGHDILEIPITYIPRGRSEGKKIYWADGFLSLWTLFKYRFFD
ncbi:MAG TPA: glycosyltransferase family 2 protein [Candidatus Sumerlaeota bacterium]|nr:glycosyltransferase family 2 protein [Candidatus Sumerlaeota bacterium]HPS02035.1 glycosyltransferase family 2 protein [Candidatus Sumerlaeota bacterium]